MEVTLVPEIPRANEKVKVKLVSYSFDINSSEMEISVNGKVIKKEVGLKKFYFNTGNVGEETKLKIVVTKNTGEIITKEYTLIPAEVDLIYELEKPHKPFGYKGKSTPLSHSNLTVFAFPTLLDKNGNIIPKEKLIYK
jgi:hypothetical protein